jgi:hypothetical protein
VTLCLVSENELYDYNVRIRGTRNPYAQTRSLVTTMLAKGEANYVLRFETRTSQSLPRATRLAAAFMEGSQQVV